MDTITIRELEVHYHVGVPDAERARPQRLLLTLEMEHDCSAAAAADDLTRTIDYFAVTRRLIALGEGRSWKLIETLAVEIAGLVLGEFGASRVAVEVRKFIVPETRWVSVRVERPAGGEGIAGTAEARLRSRIGGVPGAFR
jgi:FolB domain-containing protein